MKLLALTTLCLAAATAAAAQEEGSMTMDQVPATVMDALNAANTLGVEIETVQMDDGVYEFAGKDANGMHVEFDVMEDGTIEEIEQEIAMDALPAEVKAALEANLAGFAPTMIEQSTRTDGTVVYEFEGTHDGAEIDAEVAADGTGFMMNDDMAG